MLLNILTTKITYKVEFAKSIAESVVLCGLNIKQSHPVRGAWIEIVPGLSQGRTGTPSHPVRGVWIEIGQMKYITAFPVVTPRMGCVD